MAAQALQPMTTRYVLIHYESLSSTQSPVTVIMKKALLNSPLDKAKAISSFHGHRVYIDLNGLSPDCLIGKYANRICPTAVGDRSYMRDTILIKSVSPAGDILFTDTDPILGEQTDNLDPSYSKGTCWVMSTPEKSGKKFFYNIIADLRNGQKKTKVRALVDKIFKKIGRQVHLESYDVYGSLRYECLRSGEKDLLKDVNRLEKLLGPIEVIYLPKAPRSKL